jgi:hypothetical protein
MSQSEVRGIEFQKKEYRVYVSIVVSCCYTPWYSILLVPSTVPGTLPVLNHTPVYFRGCGKHRFFKTVPATPVLLHHIFRVTLYFVQYWDTLLYCKVHRARTLIPTLMQTKIAVYSIQSKSCTTSVDDKTGTCTLSAFATNGATGLLVSNIFCTGYLRKPHTVLYFPPISTRVLGELVVYCDIGPAKSDFFS